MYFNRNTSFNISENTTVGSKGPQPDVPETARQMHQIDLKSDDVTYKCQPRNYANFTRNYTINRLVGTQYFNFVFKYGISGEKIFFLFW